MYKDRSQCVIIYSECSPGILAERSVGHSRTFVTTLHLAFFARPSRRVGAGACEVKAGTNNSGLARLCCPPAKEKAGQARASTVGCVKADLDYRRVQRSNENNQQGRTKGMTGAEALGCVMGRLEGLLFRPKNQPRTASTFGRPEATRGGMACGWRVVGRLLIAIRLQVLTIELVRIWGDSVFATMLLSDVSCFRSSTCHNPNDSDYSK